MMLYRYIEVVAFFVISRKLAVGAKVEQRDISSLKKLVYFSKIRLNSVFIFKHKFSFCAGIFILVYLTAK